MSDQPPPRNHLVGVDLLRGVAILMVVVYHLANKSISWSGWTRDLGFASGLRLWGTYALSLGWVGVPLFFVLSGFCIEFSTLKAGKLRLMPFFWKRFWRIYPTYLIALLVFSLFAGYGAFSTEWTKQMTTHLLFLHNLQENTFFTINPSFWSIATEVQLYLLYPFFVALRTRLGIRGSLAIAFLIASAWRAFAVAAWGLPDLLISPAFASILSCWFDWILGAYVAGCYFKGRRAFTRPIAWCVLLVPLFLASTFYKPATIWSFTLASAISAILLDGAIRVRWRMAPAVAGLAFVGTISYSLYLWHQPLFLGVKTMQRSGWSQPAIASIALLAAFVVAWLSYMAIEQSGVRLGNSLWGRIRFSERFGSRRPAPSMAAEA